MKTRLILLGLLAFLLFSCDNPANTVKPANNTNPPEVVDTHAPRVDYVKLGFDDRSYAKFSGDDFKDISVYYFMYIYLENKDRHADVESITIRNPLGSEWEFTKDELEWDDIGNKFELFNFYSSSRPDFAMLGDYTVTLKQVGKTDSEFKFKAYNNEPNLNTGNAYSSESPLTPKFVIAPDSLAVSMAGNKLSITADSISEKYYGLFVWLYDGSNKYIDVYDVAWPFKDDEYSNMALSEELTADQASKAKSVIVGLLAKTHSSDDADVYMIYRYLHRFQL